MKRDLDLLKAIMLALEEELPETNQLSEIFYEIEDDDKLMLNIAVHVELLADAGYIKLGKPVLNGRYPDAYILKILPAGYDYLDELDKGFSIKDLKKQLPTLQNSLTLVQIAIELAKLPH